MTFHFPSVIKNGSFQIIPTQVFSTNSTSYIDAFDFIYPGSDTLNINKFETLVWNDDSGTVGYLRVFDETNETTIAEINIEEEKKKIVELKPIKLHSDKAIFKVQLINRNGLKNTNFSGFNIYY